MTEGRRDDGAQDRERVLELWERYREDRLSIREARELFDRLRLAYRQADRRGDAQARATLMRALLGVESYIKLAEGPDSTIWEESPLGRHHGFVA